MKIDCAIFSVDNRQNHYYPDFWFTVSQMMSFFGIRPILYICGSRDERGLCPGDLSRQYGDIYWIEHDGPSVVPYDKYHIYGQLGRIYGLKMCQEGIAMIHDIDLYPLCNYNDWLTRFKAVFDKYKVLNLQTTYNRSGRYCASTLMLDVAFANNAFSLDNCNDVKSFVSSVIDECGCSWCTDECFLNARLPRSQDTKIRIIERIDRNNGMKYAQDRMSNGAYHDLHASRPYNEHSSDICNILRKINPDIQSHPLTPDALVCSDWYDYSAIANPACLPVHGDHIWEVKEIPETVSAIVIGDGDSLIGRREVDYLRSVGGGACDIYCVNPSLELLQNDPKIHVIPLGTLHRNQIQRSKPYVIANRYIERSVLKGECVRQNRILCCFNNSGIYYRRRYGSVRNQWLDWIAGNSDVDTIISGNNLDYMRTMLHYDYVLSPDGIQPQCYRTFEALACGCIPVVRDDPVLRASLDGMPAIFVSESKHLTLDYLNTQRDAIIKATSLDKLSLRFWMRMLTNIPHKINSLGLCNASYAVITYSIGCYNLPRVRAVTNEPVDYVCVTDEQEYAGKEINGWRMYYDHTLMQMSAVNAVSYVKQHVFQYTRAECVVVLDASISINGSLCSLINEFISGGYDFGLVKHKGNNSDSPVWTDLDRWGGMCGDNHIIERQKRYMEQYGFNRSRRSLIQGGFAIYRKTKASQMFLDEVYNHIMACTDPFDLTCESDRCRVVDQGIRGWIADEYLHKGRASIMCLEANIMHSGPLMLYYHNSDRPRRTGGHTEWFLNEKVTGFYWPSVVPRLGIKVYIQLARGGLGNKLFSIGLGEVLRLRGYDVYYVRGIETHGWTFKFLQTTILENVPFVDDLPNLPARDYGSIWDKKISSDTVVSEKLLISAFRLNQTPSVRQACWDLLQMDVVSEKMLASLYPNIDWEDAVAVHVRRGDYVKRSDEVYNLLDDTDYYEKAFQEVGVSHTFIVISDDIEYCKKSQVFTRLKHVIYHESSGSIQERGLCDLWLISKCRYNILANSTFSFWGGYLNRNAKSVVVPYKWSKDRRDHWNAGIIDGWIKVPFESRVYNRLGCSAEQIIRDAIVVTVDERGKDNFRRRFERMLGIVPQNIMIFPVRPNMPPAHNLSMNWIEILQRAIDTDQEFVMAFEDDAYPRRDALDEMNRLIKIIPKEADVIFWGINLGKHYVDNGEWIKSGTFYGSHAVTVFRRAYKTLLSMLKQRLDIPLDILLSTKLPNVYAPRSDLFIQYNATRSRISRVCGFNDRNRPISPTPPEGFDPPVE